MFTAHPLFPFNSQNEAIVLLSVYNPLDRIGGISQHLWADATRAGIGDKRPRLEQADADKIIAAGLPKMGEVAFSDSYEKRKKMSLDEAVQYILEENND